jgi:hypothetical protein
VSSATLNTIGQVLSLVGLLMLFVFGMPFRIRAGGGDVVTTNPTESGKRAEALYGFLSWVGLFFAVAGVAAQIAANYSN